MGIEVPVFNGAERLARELNIPVVFGRIKRLKRGYYELEFKLISDQSKIPENSLAIKRVSNQREEKVFSNQRIEDNLSPEEFLLKVGKISKSKEVLFETAYNDLSKRNPIEDRIGDLNKFEEVLEGNFNKMDIAIDFEYAIFNEDNLTKIASEGYEIDAPNYSSFIFKDENDLSNSVSGRFHLSSSQEDGTAFDEVTGLDNGADKQSMRASFYGSTDSGASLGDILGAALEAKSNDKKESADNKKEEDRKPK